MACIRGFQNHNCVDMFNRCVNCMYEQEGGINDDPPPPPPPKPEKERKTPPLWFMFGVPILAVAFFAAINDPEQNPVAGPSPSVTPPTSGAQEGQDDSELPPLPRAYREFARPPLPSGAHPLPEPSEKSQFVARMLEERGVFLNDSRTRTTTIHRENSMWIQSWGEALNGLPHGNGMITYRDESPEQNGRFYKYFMGQMSRGLLNGNGRMTYAHGSIDFIESQWLGTPEDPYPQGDILIKYKNGSVFLGRINNKTITSGECFTPEGLRLTPNLTSPITSLCR